MSVISNMMLAKFNSYMYRSVISACIEKHIAKKQYIRKSKIELRTQKKDLHKSYVGLGFGQGFVIT